MAADGTNDVKPSESEHTVRLANMPVDAPRLERSKGQFKLGERTYPVWTPAMVEAREKFRKAGKKWYLLYDKLYDLRNLREAWKQVEANQGAAGLSGETIERYREGLEWRLLRLAQRLKDCQYRARPIRRKLIPKGDGSGKMRPLGIPEVEDRIVQAAIVRLIEPIFEAKFLPCSFGFRPTYSAHHALAVVEAALVEGRTSLVDGDIQDCFGSILREPMMEVVAREIGDSKLLALIRQFLEADIVEEMRRWTPERGTPQGAVLSPLLANIFMHEFDQRMTEAGYQVVRYADDFVLICGTRDEAEAARSQADRVLQQMGLTLHPTKTRVVAAAEDRFQFLGYEFWPEGRQPRQSSATKLKDAIRRKTPRCSGRSLRQTILSLNLTLRGWYAYFRHSFWNVFSSTDGFVRRRLRSILRKWDKRKGTARPEDNTRYPNCYFVRLGLFSMAQAHHEAVGARGLLAFPARA